MHNIIQVGACTFTIYAPSVRGFDNIDPAAQARTVAAIERVAAGRKPPARFGRSRLKPHPVGVVGNYGHW